MKLLIGLRVIKEHGIVNSIPVTLDMDIAAEKSHKLYVEHLKQEELKKLQKAFEKQWQVEKKRLHENL